MFEARVYNVFIASPGNAAELRAIARDVILHWNDQHADAIKVVLLPKMWEKNTAPGNAPAQETINREVLDHSDLVIAIWRHLWGEGTGEEVERSIQDNSREVMQYFSDEEAPTDVKNNELHDRLNEYRKKLESEGRPYYERYASPEEFREKLTWQLDKKIRQLMEQQRLSIENFTPSELELLPYVFKSIHITYGANRENGFFEVSFWFDQDVCHFFSQNETENLRQNLSSLFTKGVLINAEDKHEMDPVEGICFLNPQKRSEIENIMRKAKRKHLNT